MPRRPLRLSPHSFAEHVRVNVLLALDAGMDATDEVLLRTGAARFGCHVDEGGATLVLATNPPAGWTGGRRLGRFGPAAPLGMEALRELVLACAEAWLAGRPA